MGQGHDNLANVANKALTKFNRRKRIHLTVDMDTLKPVKVDTGTGTPVPGGISYREAHLIMEILADSGKVAAMDLLEINPIPDIADKTADLVAGLALSALGKSIL